MTENTQCENEDGLAVRAIHNNGIRNSALHYCLACYEEFMSRYGKALPQDHYTCAISRRDIQKNDLVMYKDHLQQSGKCLHCATFVYKRAVVWSIDPFILVSEIGDMVWTSTVKIEDFEVYDVASSTAISAVEERMLRANQNYKVEHDNPGLKEMLVIPGATRLW